MGTGFEKDIEKGEESMTPRKIVGRVLILIGVAFSYTATGCCLAGAWLADIDWKEEERDVQFESGK